MTIHCIYIWPMTYRRSQNKNQKLIKRYNLWFEDIIEAIAQWKILDTIAHYNTEKYSHQHIYIVHIWTYIYTVPFIYESTTSVFLKTITPQRKFKKEYLLS